MTDALKELIAAAEAGEEYIERDIQDVFGSYRNGSLSVSLHRAYRGSLDSAKHCHSILFPDMSVMIVDHGTDVDDAHRWSVKTNWEHMTYEPTFTAAGPFGYESRGSDPARAWLLAILKAKLSEATNNYD